MEKIKASDYIVEWLSAHGVDTVFGYQGGMVTHLADSISNHSKMKFVQVYHEQTAAFAAVGYARHNCRLGIAIATSGPGATNLITGIADAFFDSVPVIFITGQVNTYEYKYEKPIRQLGFQETNIVEVVKPITKYAKLVDKIEDLPNELAKAFEIANSGRKGPVLLDLPMNIQREFLTSEQLVDIKPQQNTINVDKLESELKNIADEIKKSERPLLLIGGGIATANAFELLDSFIEKTKLPFVSSLLGKTACNEKLAQYVGTIGSYGNRCANMAIANADLLLVLGARLDVRQTGGVVSGFVKEGKIIHLDIDRNELEHSRISDKSNINIDISDALKRLISRVEPLFNSEWHNYLTMLKNNYNQTREIIRTQVKSAPYDLMNYLNIISEDTDIYCADVGQNQMWAMQMLQLTQNQRFYTSGGFGAMGSALPISLGVAFAKKNDATIYSINGDGGTHMALQSLMLIKQYDLPIKVIVINNKTLGMITQFQELYFNNNMVGTTAHGGYLVPDFESLAKAYGLNYFRVDQTNNRQFDKSDFIGFVQSKNCLLEYIIDNDCRVYPKLEFNQPIYNSSPALPRDELIDAMLIKIVDIND